MTLYIFFKSLQIPLKTNKNASHSRGIFVISLRNLFLISPNMALLTSVEMTSAGVELPKPGATVMAPVGSEVTMASGLFFSKLNFIFSGQILTRFL